MDPSQVFKNALEVEKTNPNDLQNRFGLACLFLYGIGTEKNGKKAFDMFSELSAKKNVSAIEALANMYIEGQYVNVNLEKAEEIIKEQLIKINSGKSLNSAGSLYYKLLFKVGGNQSTLYAHKAFDLFNKAVELGYEEANYYLGEYYLFGRNTCLIDENKAYFHYKKAALVGHEDAISKVRDIEKTQKFKQGLGLAKLFSGLF
ncbi:sel1 repeat family protein [Acinetobacter sp. A3.8]|uniref:Sel1 repeat family protein n=1 Tax=Acinetobacter sedimenti TaxID=2919922 RepID=A0A9X1WXL2_9GAMM|nr:tetratricopeptide repeat protein [Acinetobacter sedimenti]MCJ8145370.1 sel1 repeat family protein [Acinetobacter sedimenti]